MCRLGSNTRACNHGAHAISLTAMSHASDAGPGCLNAACKHAHTQTHTHTPLLPLQRAWRSAADARRRSQGICTGGALPTRGPNGGAALQTARTTRLRGWLRGASSTNTGFGRSFTSDRGDWGGGGPPPRPGMAVPFLVHFSNPGERLATWGAGLSGLSSRGRKARYPGTAQADQS